MARTKKNTAIKIKNTKADNQCPAAQFLLDFQHCQGILLIRQIKLLLQCHRSGFFQLAALRNRSGVLKIFV